MGKGDKRFAGCVLFRSGLRDGRRTKGLFIVTMFAALSLCMTSCSGDGPATRGGDVVRTGVDAGMTAGASGDPFGWEGLEQLGGFLEKFAFDDQGWFEEDAVESEPVEEPNEMAPVNTDGEIHRIGIDVECEENVMFNKYDIEILVDGESIGVVGHGTSKAFEVALFEGHHTVEARKEGDSGVRGSFGFLVTGDTLQSCLIRCRGDWIQALGTGSFSSVSDSLDGFGWMGENLAHLFDSLGVDEVTSEGFDDDEDFLNCRDGEWAARKNFENYGEVIYPNEFDCFWKTGLIACEPQEDGSYRIEVNASVVDDDGFSSRTRAGGIVKDGEVSDFWVDL